jgi:hypothetical protein
MLIITILGNYSATDWLARLMSYVPGSEKETDTDAIDHAKGLLGRLRQNLPSPKSDDSSPTTQVNEVTDIKPGDAGEVSG